MDFYLLTEPVRPPAWRWLGANHLADHGRLPSHKWNDRWTQITVRFTRQLRACTSDADRKRVARRYADLSAAHDIYEKAALPRWVLEARLLAGESFETIATKCVLTQSVVEAFHEVFFHIGDRLRATGYIASFFFGKRLFAGAIVNDVPLTLRWVGYTRGPVALDRAIANLGNWRSVIDLFDLNDPVERKHLRSHLRIQAAIMASTLPVDSRTGAAALILEDLARCLKESEQSDQEIAVEAARYGPVTEGAVGDTSGCEPLEGAAMAESYVPDPGTTDAKEDERFVDFGAYAPAGKGAATVRTAEAIPA